MKTKIALALFLFITLMSRPALALIEFRGIAGLDIIDPSELNKFLGQNGIKELYVLPRLGVSAFVKPFDFDLGLGVEYLSQNIKVDAAGGGNSNEGELNATRISVKLYYHLIETTFFTGPTAAVGLRHTSVLNAKTPSTTYDYNSGQNSSFSLGWETGFKIGAFMLGGEAGYQWYTIKSLSGPSGSANFTVDLSTVYVSGFMGLSF